jgi:hypothetical protein
MGRVFHADRIRPRVSIVCDVCGRVAEHKCRGEAQLREVYARLEEDGWLIERFTGRSDLDVCPTCFTG